VISRIPTFKRIARRMRTQGFWLRAVAGAIFLVSLGFVSNTVSSASCVDATRAHISNQFRRGGPPPHLTWLSPASLRNAAHDSRGVLGATLLTFSNHRGQRYLRERTYMPAAPLSAPEPWAFTRSHAFDCPFVVRVYYGFSAVDGVGRIALQEHLAFFGLHVPIFDDTFFLL